MDTRILCGTTAILMLGALATAPWQDPVAPEPVAPEPVAPEPGSKAPAHGLQRLEPIPVPAQDDEDPLRRVFGRDFDRERWCARLSTPDLAAREGAYDDLLRRARIDPLARAFLEEIARDEQRVELAWTARLALRELGQRGLGGPGLFRDGLLLRDHDELEALFDEMLGQRPELHALLLPRGGPFELESPRGSVSTSGMQIVQTPEGARIVLDEDGGTREYTGKTLAAILEQHPELRERMHVSTERSRPVRTDKLGVRVVPVSSVRGAELGLTPGAGLTVLSTYPGTIAALLGVRAGDVLLELNGEPLRHADDITARLGAPARATGTLRVSLLWVDDLGQRRRRSWP